MNAPVFIKLLNVEWHNVAGVKQKDFLRGTIKDCCLGIIMIVSFRWDLQNFNYYLCLILMIEHIYESSLYNFVWDNEHLFALKLFFIFIWL